MKTKSLISLGAALFLLFVAAGESMAGVGWSVSIFDGPLGACGYWINHPVYGRCWQPAYVASNWYPYCEGYWMWTNCGWYWVSTEPWGWATYHYGRWGYDPYYGWIWEPDTVWGPSWVCWREGGGYCGWAPLPPGAVFGPAGEIVYRSGPVPDRFFVFVDLGHFGEPIHRSGVIVNNTVILNKTVNITRFTRVNNVVVNNGPNVNEIQRVSSRKLTEALPREALQRGAPARGTIPQTVRPTANEPGRATGSPQAVRGRETGAQQAVPSGRLGGSQVVRGGTGQGVYAKNQTEPRAKTPPATAEKSSGQPRTYQNFGTRGPSPQYSATTPDSIKPRQRTTGQPSSQKQPPRGQGAAQKQGQPRPEQGRQDNPKKTGNN